MRDAISAELMGTESMSYNPDTEESAPARVRDAEETIEEEDVIITESAQE